MDFEIIRLQLYIPSIEKKMLDATTGYLRILEFDEGTDTMVADAIKSLQEQGMQGLVLDLRGCPGGLLTSTAGTADQLIPAGPIIFVESGNGSQYYYRAVGEPLGIPLVVLVDGSTASGAEVLAGDIKDSGTGLLVGETTFGKGTVQNFYVLPSGSAIKLTIARYYTRNYYDVAAHKGIHPDLYLSGDWYAQLDKALELLHQQLPYGQGVAMRVGDKYLLVGKKSIALPMAPFMSKGSVYIPLRQTAEAMGVSVAWQDHQVVLSTVQKKFTVDLQNNTLTKSGFKLSASFINKNGTIFLSARFLAEAFDWNLEWDETTKTIHINF